MNNKMNNEQLDALFRKVFDEAEPGDATHLSVAAQADLDREEAVLTSIRSGLQDLADIPECQLGADRLREAILNRGALPARGPLFPNWFRAALPVAACAVIGAFFLLNKPASFSGAEMGGEPATSVAQSPNVVEPDAPGQSAPSATREPSAEPNTTGSADAAVKVSIPKGIKARFVAKKSVGNSSVLAYAKPMAQAPTLTGAGAEQIANSVGNARTSGSVSDSATGALKGFADRGNESPTMSPDAMPSQSEPKVVIVTAGTDPQTRASSATEVDKKNVVFGG